MNQPGDEASVQREDYLRKTYQIVDDLSQKVDHLVDRMQEDDSQAHKRLHSKLEDLKRKQRAMLTRLKEVSSASPETWKAAKAGADMALVILAESYQNVISIVR